MFKTSDGRITKLGWAAIAAAVLGIGAAYMLRRDDTDALPPQFATGNGRIEATEIDLATKFAGRLSDVLVSEGAFVEAGQVLARMDTVALDAQVREAQAQLRQAQSAQSSAAAVVAQRQSARATALAVVAQHRVDLAFARKQLERTRQLVEEKFYSAQQLDVDESERQSAAALLVAAQSGVVEADAAIAAARSQLVEAQSGIDAARATLQRIEADAADAQLSAPRNGRVQHVLAQAGEVLGAGGKVLSLLDLSEVYMRIYLPETVAGKLAIGGEARLILDAAPGFVIPATVSFVSAQAQFTPKTVETASERQKLVFQVRLQIAPELLKKHEAQVKTGLPGVAFVRLDSTTPWPEHLRSRVPADPPTSEP
ncbi:MAG: HlyD family efflux transporter periplasmic adaptor subunit [Candidatus Accumulibacter meliphilus]|jgi:HlyD family secretion protein|uniref:HlyD family secretion protein n=1 Tax=Candidatus Accumulibacter meliphilus TaxID=2211374 RepID=UPI002FC2766F